MEVKYITCKYCGDKIFLGETLYSEKDGNYCSMKCFLQEHGFDDAVLEECYFEGSCIREDISDTALLCSNCSKDIVIGSKMYMDSSGSKYCSVDCFIEIYNIMETVLEESFLAS